MSTESKAKPPRLAPPSGSVRSPVTEIITSDTGASIRRIRKLRVVLLDTPDPNEHGYVPAYYLFDAEGKLKSFAAGERGLDMLSSAIERVLAAGASQVTSAQG